MKKSTLKTLIEKSDCFKVNGSLKHIDTLNTNDTYLISIEYEKTKGIIHEVRLTWNNVINIQTSENLIIIETRKSIYHLQLFTLKPLKF